MSFIVKGFDIPKDAVYFKLSFYDGNRENEYGVNGSLKPYIIQIPKGHGRLIDGDELKSIKSIQSADFNSIETIQKWIDNAPTILDMPTIDLVRCKDCKHSKNCIYPAKWNWCPDGERKGE